MRVLHIIPSISAQEGGPSVAIHAIAEALIHAGLEVHVASTTEAVSGEGVLPQPEGTASGVKYHIFPRNISAYKISLALASWIKRNLATFDLLHIHALFSFSSTVSARIATQERLPYIVRPLGVLNTWGLQHRRPVLKRLSLRFNELPILRRAAAIHYTSEAERREATIIDPQLGDERSAVIPLPIECVARDTSPELFLERVPAARGREVILFLSRIDKKKGLELLFEAFGSVANEERDAVLIVAGTGNDDYVRTLVDRAAELGIRDRVYWSGFLDPTERASAFAAARVFVLPSYSENFGIAAAEALAAGVPTIVTEGVGIAEYIRRYDAGVVARPHALELGRAIQHLLRRPDFARLVAENGRKLVRAEFSADKIGRSLASLYRSIVDA